MPPPPLNAPLKRPPGLTSTPHSRTFPNLNALGVNPRGYGTCIFIIFQNIKKFEINKKWEVDVNSHFFFEKSLILCQILKFWIKAVVPSSHVLKMGIIGQCSENHLLVRGCPLIWVSLVFLHVYFIDKNDLAHKILCIIKLLTNTDEISYKPVSVRVAEYGAVTDGVSCTAADLRVNTRHVYCSPV